MGLRGEVFTTKVFFNEGKKTFFFNVKENRQQDLFLNIVETKKRDDTFDRHSMIIYKEDIAKFAKVLDDCLAAVRAKKVLPDYEMVSSSERRKYQFMMKANRSGDSFLTVTESRKDDDLAFQNESLRIYLEQSELFQEGFMKAHEAMLTY